MEKKFLEALGVEDLKAGELQLSLKAINDARINRGLPKIKIDERYKKNLIENKYPFVFYCSVNCESLAERTVFLCFQTYPNTKNRI